MRRVLLKMFALLACLLCSLSAVAAEAYAEYLPTSKKLTFYYDNFRSTHLGTTYDLNTGDNYPGWIEDELDVTNVVFNTSFRNALPTSTAHWFDGMSNLTSIAGLENLITSQVTDMSWMFCSCVNLEPLDLSTFNTSKVTNMGFMFSGVSWTSLNLSSFNTANVTSMLGMFYQCTDLVTLDLSSFNTMKVTCMNYMFMYCDDLTTIYVGAGWSTAAPRLQGDEMFYYCTSLVGGMGTRYNEEYIDADYAHIDGGPSNPGYLTGLIVEPYACYTSSDSTLTFYYDDQRYFRPGTTYDLNTGDNKPGWVEDELDVTKVVFNISFRNALPTSTAHWFAFMNHLTSIEGLEYLTTSQVTTMICMFSFCERLETLDVSSFDTSNVTSMATMFYFCLHLKSLDLSHFNTANVTDMSYMFYDCQSLTSIDISSFNTAKVEKMTGMFSNCKELTTIYAGDGWSMDALIYHNTMFNGSTKLVGGMGTTYDYVNVGSDYTYAHIDGGPSNPGYLSDHTPHAYACYTSSNTTLTFYYDDLRSTRTGTTYDLNSGYNDPDWLEGTNYGITRVVFDPSFADARPYTTCCWFCDMSYLSTIIGLNYLNTSLVTNMSGMFVNCSSLTSIDLSGFKTGNVNNMMNMFAGCDNLMSLDVSRFNTAQVTNMESMFDKCSGLTSLDLTNFNTAKVTTMELMFYDCSNLTTIYAGSGWSTALVSESTNMFKGCTKIKGSRGTTYNANHVDKAYAHIDGGTSNPGYLSNINAPYACYTSSNTTLTFYCDSQRESRTGTTYDLNEEMNNPGWKTDGTNASVTRVVFDSSFASARPTSTFNWFNSMTELLSITGMAYLNTSEVTNMNGMFSNCQKLTNIDLSHFNTENVTNMGYLFQNCIGLTSLNVSYLNTSKVTFMGSMFFNCSGLTSLDVSTFNTASVTYMAQMFEKCTGLSSLNLSSFNTAKVTNMQNMFYDCSGLTSLNLSGFNTAKVTNMTQMFFYCSQLVTIYAGSDWSTDAVTSSNNAMFAGCTSLVGGKGTTYDASHTGKAYAHIDGGTANPGYLSEFKEAYACYTSSNTTLTFYCDNLRSSRTGTTYDMNEGENAPGWCGEETTYNTDITRVIFDPSFADARPTSTYEWFGAMFNIDHFDGLNYLNTSEVTTMKYMFSDCTGVLTADLSNFDTRNVTDMTAMFAYCLAEELDLSSFSTGNVTNMSGMFAYCSNLRTIYVGDTWSTSSVTSSDMMFLGCDSLVGGKGTTFDENHIDAAYAHIDGGTSNPGYFTDSNVPVEAYACYTADNTTLTFYYDNERESRSGTTYDLNTGNNEPGWRIQSVYSTATTVVFDPSFDAARPTTTSKWFYSMSKLQSFTGMEYLHTDQVTDMSYMFRGCSMLIEGIDVSHFNTSSVTDMTSMFAFCYRLRSLDLSNFNTAKVTNMSEMFDGNEAMSSVDLSSFNTSSVTTMRNMFWHCYALTSLDLSSFNTSKVTNMAYMFLGNNELVTISVGDGWSTDAVTSSSKMFQDCTKIKGGKGTTYDASHVDVAYAHVDGGPSNPGYLTTALIPGDVDDNGTVNIADVSALIDYLLSGVGTGVNLANADVDGSGTINIADVSSLIDILLHGGAK